MSKGFTRHNNPEIAEVNPAPSPVQPPPAVSTSGDPVFQLDMKEVVTGARALIAAMSSTRPEDRELAKRAIAGGGTNGRRPDPGGGPYGRRSDRRRGLGRLGPTPEGGRNPAQIDA